MILYLKALFEYALWPAVFDCTVRYGIDTGQVRSRVIRTVYRLDDGKKRKGML